MDKTVVATWNVGNMEDMMRVLTEALDTAGSLGHRSGTVRPNKLRIALVKEVMADGSTIMNLNFHDGVRDRLTVMGRTEGDAA